MTDYERNLLRHIAGESIPELRWGAAMSEAIESLAGSGYVKGVFQGDTYIYQITEKGRRAIEADPHTKTGDE